MKYRKLGETGIQVSEISLGTWQVGGKWGSGFDDNLAERIIHEAIDAGVNFIDTADVYEAGSSEATVGRVVKSRSEEVFVATKCGRQINPHVNKGYTVDVLRKYVEDSLRNTGLECLDLIQLHCPPTEVYYRPEIFELFDRLKDEGKIKNLGVSVEKVEEGLKAIEYPNVSTVQIIFNMFRQRPSELFFEQVQKKNIGVIVRVPLASGLLSGKFSSDSTFEKDDHRNFNREGAAFDKGETFSGVPFDVGLQAVDELKKIFPQKENLAPIALRWILDFPEVGCIIPGASKVEHLKSNLEAVELPQLTKDEKVAVNQIYDRHIKKHVHQLW
ncbi:aldo/keto reductase [Flagellimonas oceanensis]|uniref:aldo/keto reductase n=1 Tax=Flagellimonas oceanensis TaxID=2499163 RepID=UPI000F8E40BB|nr:aldo/keto reductase [Allomuricauda oceanensis]|tara:strand:- start:22861 stop:23847 length:987 start_codon:yes stop_codon:yes gene_type:complete